MSTQSLKRDLRKIISSEKKSFSKDHHELLAIITTKYTFFLIYLLFEKGNDERLTGEITLDTSRLLSNLVTKSRGNQGTQSKGAS